MAATYRLTYDADGNPTRIKDDFAAAGAPTVDDDAASGGWSTGSLWYVPATDTLYLCESAATGAADWVAVTGGGPGGGAPTDATYLVGTASAGLSNEIVVGTTPGGELGGTWADPTVDATHAGSSHASVQAAAEATAAGALSAHAGDADAHHGWPLTEPDIPASIARDSEVTSAIASHAADASAHHSRYTDAEADARAAAAITTHEAAADPHPAYLTAAEGDAAYELEGSVASHAADPDAHHTWPLTDGDIPSSVARDAEVSSAVAAHADTADAHHIRYTDAEADARAAAAVATHAGDADAHHAWPLADGDIPASIARDAEVASAVATHEAAADPHPGYVQEAATPGGELGGTYAAPTVDSVHAGSSHAATQAAAEATAAGAVASHAADADAHHAEDHAARHAAGGADALKLDDLAAPDDTTDLDASTGAHGLLPKLSGSTSEFLRGDGSWAAGAGGVTDHGALTGLADDDHSQYLRTDGSRGLSGTWTPGDGIDMAGGSFRVPGGEILPANLDARALAAEVDGSGSLLGLYVGVDSANPRKRVLLTGDTPDEPVVHVYTASTTWTKPTAPTFSHIVVECVGGGGGGGGPSATSTNQASQSGGGGGGGYTRNLFPASVLTGSTYTVTVGAGGNGRGGGNTGYDGTSSSFSGSGITSAPVAGGGSGGGGMNAGASYSTTGGGGAGSASNGDISVPGMPGGNGVRISLPGVTSAVAAGNAWGGGSVLGTAQRQSSVGVAGYNSAAYGVGGSGAGINQSSTTVAGGDGSDGVVIVTEYYMGVAV